ncbi:hypothetical protein F4782DRAFT_549279 [Xylaria castorea]|nr:hypothetical protein F4782DRAFT_549279 [Xylaria castorea]
MARRIFLRLRHLLPFPLSFRLTSHLPKLVRSFFSGSFGIPASSNRPRRPAKLHATSYLDGLRGLAAVIVCVAHYTEVNHPNLTPWYGVSPDPATAPEPSWIQLPFVRVMFSGRPMVHVFFVMSGFALSVKALAAVRARDFAKCHSILISAALRRPIRLCGPPVVSMVFIILFIRASWLWGILPTLRQQLNDWVVAAYYHVTWPWSSDIDLSPPYNVNLWTIPIELCHSTLLFLIILALSRVRTAARVAFALAFVMYCLRYGRWAAAEYIGGIVLAEAHLASTERETHECLPLVNSAPCISSSPQGSELEDTQRNKRSSTMNAIQATLNIAILAVALFIFGWPDGDSSHTPGIRHLVYFIPGAFNPRNPQAPQNFWFAIAAMGTVWSCGRLTFVRKTILESRFAQYAGRVSFAVYIVHGPVFSLFQDAVLGASARPEKWVGSKGSGLRGWIGIDTAFNRTLCWAAGFAVLFPLVLVAAHLFCRFVDEPFMRLAKKIEIWAVSDPDEVLEREMRSRQHVEDKRWA